MNIGIIIFSHTGNTNVLAQKLQEKLSSAGHTVSVERVTQRGEKIPDMNNVQLDFKPDAEKYDVLVFGSPVWGFSLSSVMATYLKQIPSLKNKKTICFVTKALPFLWTGGKGAVKQMIRIVESKKANVCGSFIVNQKSIKSENELNEEAEKISKYVNCI